MIDIKAYWDNRAKLNMKMLSQLQVALDEMRDGCAAEMNYTDSEEVKAAKLSAFHAELNHKISTVKYLMDQRATAK